tara:strand:- start:454 stop:864 length:411 start_codon:yes stop_codon:yes gene_type:complete
MMISIIESGMLVPVLGVLAGIIIPLSVFIWLYYEGKGKRETIREIAKNMDDPSKLEDLLGIFEERKKEPIDYRRSGVVTLFVGIGLFLLGFVITVAPIEGVGLLVGAIGIGQIVAGYLYPNTSEELTNAVEKYEES